jgi:cation diffusion facilitator family transporter
MVMVGLQILIDSIIKFNKGEIQSPDPMAVLTSLLSAGIIFMVYRFNIRLAERSGSLAIKSVALDNRSDALVSIGATIGIVGSIWGIAWLDLVTALIVGLIICKTGWDIFKEASHMLTDGFNAHDLEQFKQTITNLDGVERVKDIKGRFHGDQIFVDLIIEVDKDMSVYESHAITEKVELELEEKHQIDHVHVHIEPH